MMNNNLRQCFGTDEYKEKCGICKYCPTPKECLKEKERRIDNGEEVRGKVLRKESSYISKR